MQKLNREKSLKRIKELTLIHLAKKNGAVAEPKIKNKHTETLSESEDSDGGADTKMKSEDKKKFENKGTVSKSKLENKR